MAPSHVLTPDAQAILLLCGRFGKHEDGRAKALSLREYGEVADWLISRELRPADLLRPEGSEALRDFGRGGKVTPERLEALLQRGAAMAMFLESWTSEGGWVLARSDESYPWRLKRRLRHLAPPILYGVGDTSLLDRGGLSMVGSRDADDAALSFVADFAAKCARDHVQVVSGGARGVDRTAMEAGLAEGATVVGALANGLAQTARRKAYRQAIRAGQLTLVSAYHPDSKFAVWKAMDRNKHIYALSDAALVAHSAVDQGGTWAGATENLEHGWVPLLVRSEEPLPVGNRALLSRGGIRVDRTVLRESEDLFTWLNRTIPQAQGARVDDVAEPGVGEVAREEAVALPGATPSPAPPSPPPVADPAASPVLSQASSPPFADRVREALSSGESVTLYELVWPALEAFLVEPRSERDVEAFFPDLRLTQARDWLGQAVERGDAVRTERPVMYRLPDQKDGKPRESSSDPDSSVPERSGPPETARSREERGGSEEGKAGRLSAPEPTGVSARGASIGDLFSTVPDAS